MKQLLCGFQQLIICILSYTFSVSVPQSASFTKHEFWLPNRKLFNLLSFKRRSRIKRKLRGTEEVDVGLHWTKQIIRTHRTCTGTQKIVTTCYTYGYVYVLPYNLPSNCTTLLSYVLKNGINWRCPEKPSKCQKSYVYVNT